MHHFLKCLFFCLTNRSKVDLCHKLIVLFQRRGLFCKILFLNFLIIFVNNYFVKYFFYNLFVAHFKYNLILNLVNKVQQKKPLTEKNILLGTLALSVLLFIEKKVGVFALLEEKKSVSRVRNTKFIIPGYII